MRSIPLAAAAALLLAAPVLAAPPGTPRRPVIDVYGADSVRDDYRWLEDWSDAEVRSWSEAQNAHARAFLDALPMREAIRERLETLTHDLAPAYRQVTEAGGRYFALKSQPPRQQPVLVMLPSLLGTRGERMLVDPVALDTTARTSMDFFEPSHDGRLLAVSLSRSGTESGTVHVWEVASGRKLADEVPRVNGGTAGGSVAWNAEGTGFYRTRYPAPGERAPGEEHFHQQVWFHRLGTPESADTYVVGREFPRIAEISLHGSGDGRWVAVEVRNGDGGDKEFWLIGPDGSPRQVSRLGDEIVFARVHGGHLYLMSRARSLEGEVLRVPLAEPDLAKAETTVPASDRSLEWFAIAHDRLYVEDIAGGPSRLRMFALDGRPLGEVPVPAMTTVRGVLPVPGGAVAFERESWTEPPAWWRFDPARRRLERTALVMRSPADFSDVVVTRETATSRDGTPVPVTILRRRTTTLGPETPFHLYAYGGYGISQRPSFIPARRLWLEQGGAMAIAHIRGGGELGEKWHRAGYRTLKQNDYDDFGAAAAMLVGKGWTVPKKLAIEGRSNGGLLMGAALTQFPDRFGAVVAAVGVFDMLRVEESPNGAFNVTEYGTVRDPVQYRALRGYSPYHNVRDGVAYPAVLFTTGANDPRVDPMHSRKMTARLQAASSSGQPVLLRTSATTGHGGGTPRSVRNALAADQWSFVFDRLGVPYRPVRERITVKGPKLEPPAELGKGER